MKAAIAKAGTPVTQYLDKYSLPGYMWDEIAGPPSSILPSSPARSSFTWTSISITAKLRQDPFLGEKTKVPPYLVWAMSSSISMREKFSYKSTSTSWTRQPPKRWAVTNVQMALTALIKWELYTLKPDFYLIKEEGENL